ncbi:hypothetical protein ABW21_db0204348 [Orbilia brochopaga]|nr:hypothetical protein ABW21_db0204348 [Drechslerella brochopaga]
MEIFFKDYQQGWDLATLTLGKINCLISSSADTDLLRLALTLDKINRLISSSADPDLLRLVQLVNTYEAHKCPLETSPCLNSSLSRAQGNTVLPLLNYSELGYSPPCESSGNSESDSEADDSDCSGDSGDSGLYIAVTRDGVALPEYQVPLISADCGVKGYDGAARQDAYSPTTSASYF